MRILLLSMPDSFEHMPALAIRMPNGALTSLAGNIDSHHEVAVADLILVQQRVRESVEQLMRELEPDVVGLSVMTFQRKTALRICELVRSLRPTARIVVGGYDPSLAPEAYACTDAATVDFIVRGEGEACFSELLRALENGSRLDQIPGLSFRQGDRFCQNSDRPATTDLAEIKLPRREARVLRGYTMLGRPIDVIETSRGCTYDCSFCSIIEMRGRNFHSFSIDRVLADIRDARDRGARSIFVVDDNIMLNVRRFEVLCQAIIDAGLNRLDYFVQAMTSSIAKHGNTLAPLMRRAGFRYAFLGIENILEEDLQFLRATAKTTQRQEGKKENATLQAIEWLHRSGIWVVGGLIVGNPSDTRESIAANLKFARRYVDWPYIQHPTPYPGTPMTTNFEERGLIASRALEEYDGTTAVVRSEHLAPEEIEFLRWKVERWIKLRHFPKAFLHYPRFVLRHGKEMLAHTFRGSTLSSFLGLEDERAVFARYRAIRQSERTYL
jgi:anaerobic magnesium-protoporphyrin IX monomethyl ester cyclase